jgi:hypothetical protein
VKCGAGDSQCSCPHTSRQGPKRVAQWNRFLLGKTGNWERPRRTGQRMTAMSNNTPFRAEIRGFARRRFDPGSTPSAIIL